MWTVCVKKSNWNGKELRASRSVQPSSLASGILRKQSNHRVHLVSGLSVLLDLTQQVEAAYVSRNKSCHFPFPIRCEDFSPASWWKVSLNVKVLKLFCKTPICASWFHYIWAPPTAQEDRVIESVQWPNQIMWLHHCVNYLKSYYATQTQYCTVWIALSCSLQIIW